MISFKNGQIDGVWITWSYDGIKQGNDYIKMDQ
ncbi:MAG: hypothetical protein Ct9H300mP18_10320 [Candidatus Neomarinimicrobiota bacterium]|nr:MAG: hypothetical protein Ct9H300mP18_10320 [Candidatus Neomarinimicrobiota bacterium]